MSASSSVWTSKTVLISLALGVLIYLLLFWPSCNGYGYAGYGGYHRGPSFFYFSNTKVYPSKSVRTGSRGGPGVRGGGLHGGK